MRSAARLAVAIASVGLAAFRFPTEVKVEAPATEPAFRLIDSRPLLQARSRLESTSITTCAYSSIFVGDFDITPEPLVLVRDLLAARANDALAGRTVDLRNFTVHVNNSRQVRGAVDSMFPSPNAMARAMNDTEKVGCAPDDLCGGYTLGEVEGTPLIVVVDLVIDGKEHHARCITTTPVMPPRKRASPQVAQWDAAVAAQLGCAMDKLAAQIASGTPVAIPTPPPVSAYQEQLNAEAERHAAREVARREAAAKAARNGQAPEAGED